MKLDRKIGDGTVAMEDMEVTGIGEFAENRHLHAKAVRHGNKLVDAGRRQPPGSSASWASEMRISQGLRPGYLRGARARSIRQTSHSTAPLFRPRVERRTHRYAVQIATPLPRNGCSTSDPRPGRGLYNFITTTAPRCFLSSSAKWRGNATAADGSRPGASQVSRPQSLEILISRSPGADEPGGAAGPHRRVYCHGAPALAWR